MQKYVFRHYKAWEKKLVFICFWKNWERQNENEKSMTQNHLKKREVLSHFEEGEVLVEFVSTVEDHYHQIFISAEILHWNSCLKKISSWTLAISLLFSNDLDKFKLETQIKTLKNIVAEKQFGPKEAIKIISQLHSSLKLLVSKVLKLVKLILLVPTTNVVSERSCSTLCRIKTYLWPSMAQEPVYSCLIVTTYKKQGDKLELVEVGSQFYFKNERRFSIKE